MASAAKNNNSSAPKPEKNTKKSNNVLDNESSVFDCAVCHEGRGQKFDVELSCKCTPCLCMRCMVHWTKANSGLVCPMCSATGIRVQAGEAAPLADGYYDAAMGDFATAQASGFEDKEALKAASRGLLNAIRSDARHVRAYVGMAYLLLLLANPNSAERYLAAALDIDPSNEDATKLMKYVRDDLPGEQQGADASEQQGGAQTQSSSGGSQDSQTAPSKK